MRTSLLFWAKTRKKAAISQVYIIFNVFIFNKIYNKLLKKEVVMEKKPVNFVVKSAYEAEKRLNEIVENGGAFFDIGVNPEYVNNVTVNSDGSKTTTKERVYRIIGFVDMYVGNELDPLNAVREEIKAMKKERAEMNKTLRIMNRSLFTPIVILLLIVALITLTFGILTLASILPLPAGQTPIAIVLTIVGVLALGGAVTIMVLRGKKKKELLSRKDEVRQQDAELKAREADLSGRTPQWYKDALWSVEGIIVRNASVNLVFNKD